MQQTEVRAAAIPGRLTVGQHLIPHPARAEQTTGCLQAPPLIDLFELLAVLGRADHPDASGIGNLSVEPRLTPVDGQPMRHGRRAVTESAVDTCFTGLEPGDRIRRSRHARMQFGEQALQHSAPSVGGRDNHRRHARHRQHRAARHRQLEIENTTTSRRCRGRRRRRRRRRRGTSVRHISSASAAARRRNTLRRAAPWPASPPPRRCGCRGSI